MEERSLDPDIDRYYSQEWDENARLRSGLNELEFLRTQEIIRRYLPDPPSRVLDVGGGSGVHAEWLVADGHRVTLVDPVALHVEQATASLGFHDGFSAERGDARSLQAADESFDIVLLLGPLYHLTDRSDRMQVWHETMRVLRPGGRAIAAGITKYASLFAGLEKEEIFVDAFRGVVEQDLIDGQHRNAPGKDYFTTAYFHHPDDLVGEAYEAALEQVEIVAVEGPVGMVPHLEESWNDPVRRQVLLDLVRMVESEPSLMGIGPHVLITGRKT
ncbi:MAG: class I SAM-dependent methyltransferase [Acidimicrobiia bacterium]